VTSTPRLWRAQFIYDGEVPITKLKYVLKEAIGHKENEDSGSITHCITSLAVDVRSI